MPLPEWMAFATVGDHPPGTVDYVRCESNLQRPDLLGLRVGVLRPRIVEVPASDVEALDVRGNAVYPRGSASVGTRSSRPGRLAAGMHAAVCHLRTPAGR